MSDVQTNFATLLLVCLHRAVFSQNAIMAFQWPTDIFCAILVLITINVAFVGTADDTTFCPTGFFQFQQKCYFLIKDELRYPQAMEKCENFYFGKLASIETQEEQTYLTNYIFRNLRVRNNIWIGAHGEKDASGNVRIKWSDETPLIYTNWMPGEPMTAQRDEEFPINGIHNCVTVWSAFDNQGKWQVSSCYIEFPSLCQRRIKQPSSDDDDDLKEPAGPSKKTSYVSLNWFFGIVIALFSIVLGLICYYGNFTRIKNVFQR